MKWMNHSEFIAGGHDPPGGSHRSPAGQLAEALAGGSLAVEAHQRGSDPPRAWARPNGPMSYHALGQNEASVWAVLRRRQNGVARFRAPVELETF